MINILLANKNFMTKQSAVHFMQSIFQERDLGKDVQ